MVYKRLQREVDEADGAQDIAQPLPYLEAVVNETLRLKPVVPSGQWRVTPPEGLFIDEVWIPGNTIVVVPQYLLQRDARNFSQPLEFIPERWLEKDQGLVFDDKAFFPFTIGKRSCSASFRYCQYSPLYSRSLFVCRQATGISVNAHRSPVYCKGV